VKSTTGSNHQNQAAYASNVNRYMVELGQETTPAPKQETPKKPKRLDALKSFSWNDDAAQPKALQKYVAAPAPKASMISQKNTYLGSLGVSGKTQGQAGTSNALTSFSFNTNDFPKADDDSTKTSPKWNVLASSFRSDWFNWHPHDDDIAEAVREAPSEAPQQSEANMVALKTTVKSGDSQHKAASHSMSSEDRINFYLASRKAEEMSQGSAAVQATKAVTDSNANHYMTDLGQESEAVVDIPKPEKRDALKSFSWTDNPLADSDSSEQGVKIVEAAQKSNPLGNYLRGRLV